MATIFIVDQSPFMRGSLKFLLETAGHTVIGDTNNGADATGLCGRLTPDIITIDISIDGGMCEAQKFYEQGAPAHVAFNNDKTRFHYRAIE